MEFKVKRKTTTETSIESKDDKLKMRVLELNYKILKPISKRIKELGLSNKEIEELTCIRETRLYFLFSGLNSFTMEEIALLEIELDIKILSD